MSGFQKQKEMIRCTYSEKHDKTFRSLQKNRRNKRFGYITGMSIQYPEVAYVLWDDRVTLDTFLISFLEIIEQTKITPDDTQ